MQDRLSYMPDGSTASKELLEQLRDTERRYEAALAESIGAPSHGDREGSTLRRDLMGGSSASLALPPEAPPVPDTLQEVRPWSTCDPPPKRVSLTHVRVSLCAVCRRSTSRTYSAGTPTSAAAPLKAARTRWIASCS